VVTICSSWFNVKNLRVEPTERIMNFIQTSKWNTGCHFMQYSPVDDFHGGWVHFLWSRNEPTKELFLRFEVFAAEIMKVIFWNVMPCSSCFNRGFGRIYPFHNEIVKSQRAMDNDSILKLFRNVGYDKSHMALHPRRQHSLLKYSILQGIMWK
jgi:hypothetical protein